MDEKLWIIRSQNLYIIKEIWRQYSGRNKEAFYDLISIHNSEYSSFIRDIESVEEADRKIVKCKNKITEAGFKYEWFTGEVTLCDDTFGISAKDWKAFVQAKAGSALYKNVSEKIKKRIWLAKSDTSLEYHKVYNVICRHNPKRVAKQFEKYLNAIDIKSISADEIDELTVLADKLEEFIADVRAIKRCLDIQKRK